MWAILILLAVSGTLGSPIQQSTETDTDAGIPPGYMLIEGDIIVPVFFYTSSTWGGTGWRLWSANTVPYLFAPSVTTAHRAAMLAAMDEWQAVTAVTFTPRTSQSDYLYIQNATVNSSFVGRVGGRQVINIFNWDFRFIMAHELGHALGYWHEHTRTDRDTYVQVNDANMQLGEEDNFDTHPGQLAYGPYDFDSVMHYDSCAFSICCPIGQSCSCLQACATITVLPPNESWQALIGQRDHLSFWDRRVMSFLYAESNWRFVDRGYSGTQAGTFLNPWRALGSAFSAVPAGGRVWIAPGSYSDKGIFTKAMTLDASLGGVVIGRQ